MLRKMRESPAAMFVAGVVVGAAVVGALGFAMVVVGSWIAVLP